MGSKWNRDNKGKMSTENGFTVSYTVDTYQVDMEKINDWFYIIGTNFWHDLRGNEERAKTEKTLLNRLDKMFVGY